MCQTLSYQGHELKKFWVLELAWVFAIWTLLCFDWLGFLPHQQVFGLNDWVLRFYWVTRRTLFPLLVKCMLGILPRQALARPAQQRSAYEGLSKEGVMFGNYCRNRGLVVALSRSAQSWNYPRNCWLRVFCCWDHLVSTPLFDYLF